MKANAIRWVLCGWWVAACGGSAPSLQDQARPEDEQDLAHLAAYEASVEDLDEELTASLETQPTEPPVDCESVCGLRYEICALSSRICDIAERHPTWERPAAQCTDSAERCRGAEEDTDAVCDCTPYQPDQPI